MFKLLKTSIGLANQITAQQRRTFLSHAYYCMEVWQQRLLNPIIQKVRLDEFYNELDQKYNKYKNISAIDVDIFVNAVQDSLYTDELLDIIHKLRLSADSSNTLDSTSHATIRNLLDFNKIEELLLALDDRLNYGMFLDNFTSNLLLDTFWKQKDYLSGSRVAAQLMLQEDFSHPLCGALSLLHCYNYLLNPTEWPQLSKLEEPEDEVKIRVNFLRSPYNDKHFDLRDPLQIVGKTIMMITADRKDALEKSLYLLGTALVEDKSKTEDLISILTEQGETLHADILQLVPPEFNVKSIKVLQEDTQKLLQERVKSVIQTTAENDIAVQCATYLQWEEDRKAALEKQEKRLLTAKRIANIKNIQEKIKEKETLLWYFENKEKIELQIEEKDILLAEQAVDRKHPVNTEEVYIPPEVQKKYVQTK